MIANCNLWYGWWAWKMKCLLDMDLFEMTHRPFIYNTMALKSNNSFFFSLETVTHILTLWCSMFYQKPKQKKIYKIMISWNKMFQFFANKEKIIFKNCCQCQVHINKIYNQLTFINFNFINYFSFEVRFIFVHSENCVTPILNFEFRML